MSFIQKQLKSMVFSFSFFLNFCIGQLYLSTTLHVLLSVLKMLLKYVYVFMQFKLYKLHKPVHNYMTCWYVVKSYSLQNSKGMVLI